MNNITNIGFAGIINNDMIEVSDVLKYFRSGDC